MLWPWTLKFIECIHFALQNNRACFWAMLEPACGTESLSQASQLEQFGSQSSPLVRIVFFRMVGFSTFCPVGWLIYHASYAMKDVFDAFSTLMRDNGN
jgi:hypothetical protein